MTIIGTFAKVWKEDQADELYGAHLNANFKQVGDVVDGQIDDSNVSGISGSKITAGYIPQARYGSGTDYGVPGASLVPQSVGADALAENIDMSGRGFDAAKVEGKNAEQLMGVIGDLQLAVELTPNPVGASLTTIQLPSGFGIDNDNDPQYALMYKRVCVPDEFGLSQFPMSGATPLYDVEVRCNKSLVLWVQSSGEWPYVHVRNHGIGNGYWTVVKKTAASFEFVLVGRGYCLYHFDAADLGHTATHLCGEDPVPGDGECRNLFASVHPDDLGVSNQAVLTFLINRLPYGKTA